MNDQSTTERIAELEKLAEAVTQWSNCNQAWMDSSEDTPAATVGHINEDGEKYPVAVIDCDQYHVAQDSIKLARFYAAANPLAILSLIGHIAELERKNAELVKSLQAFKALAEKWNKDAVDTGFAMSEPAFELFEVLDASHQKEDKA